MARVFGINRCHTSAAWPSQLPRLESTSHAVGTTIPSVSGKPRTSSLSLFFLCYFRCTRATSTFTLGY